MTLAEFFGCTFLTFGPVLAMFIFTIAHDPMRIIILLMSSFFWLGSFVLSSFVWFAGAPLLAAVIVSVLLQELFRYGIYIALRKTERGLRQVADNIQIVENKHTLAYVSGLGFGIISGAFSMSNILADSAGAGTVGLTGGTENFFIASAAQSLCMVLLHVFWNVIFCSGCDRRKYEHIIFVVVAHLFVSCMTLWNRPGSEWYSLTLPLNATMVVICAVIAFKIAGGSSKNVKRFIKCQ